MINLLPAYIKETREYGKKNVALFGYSVALLGTALATAAIMMVSLQFIASEEPDLISRLKIDNETIATLEKDIQNIESVASRLDTAKQIRDSSISFSELIPKIGAVLPQGVILNALSFTGGPTDPLQLDVDLLDAGLAPVLIRNLIESDLFEAADIASLSPRGTTGETSTESYQFTASLTASFKGTAEATKKAAAAAAAKKAAAAAAAAEATTPKETE